MKPLLLFLVVAVSAFVLAGESVPPSPGGGDAGRYQIAGGVVPSIKPGEGYATMFRLDTTTGRVWQVQAVAMSVQGSMVSVPTWIEVQEINGDLYRAAVGSMQPK